MHFLKKNIKGQITKYLFDRYNTLLIGSKYIIQFQTIVFRMLFEKFVSGAI